MPRYDYSDSDDSTLVDDRRRQRRTRHRSPSQSTSYSRRSYRGEERGRDGRDGEHRSDAPGKGSVAIGLITAIVAMIQVWRAKKDAEREEQERRRRRDKFETAKRERRRDEERRSRQRTQEYDERSPEGNMKRISYTPSRSKSRSRGTKRIEAPPRDLRDPSTDLVDGQDRRYANDGRARRG